MLDGSKSSIEISIHALLAESDRRGASESIGTLHFYPRSPCGERRCSRLSRLSRLPAFLSTLSLRRATWRSDCPPSQSAISIHALLAESDSRAQALSVTGSISIHALLAESDHRRALARRLFYKFLSTLSLRRATLANCTKIYAVWDFYPRSPCGERQRNHLFSRWIRYFYPRSPCGERLEGDRFFYYSDKFLSTLSLRRATLQKSYHHLSQLISIHALLAESDGIVLARMAPYTYFYPRSPCGERLHYDNYNLHCVEISIHALLAESDVASVLEAGGSRYFYPRSPCGERRRRSVKLFRQNYISIHALLAESDLDNIEITQAKRYFYPRSPCGERHVLACLVGFVY